MHIKSRHAFELRRERLIRNRSCFQLTINPGSRHPCSVPFPSRMRSSHHRIVLLDDEQNLSADRSTKRLPAPAPRGLIAAICLSQTATASFYYGQILPYLHSVSLDPEIGATPVARPPSGWV